MPRREDFRIRSLEERDLEKVLEWRNSERIRANMYTDQFISSQEHREWFARVSKDTNSEYHIFEYSGNPIGLFYVVQIDRNNTKCFWGFYIGEEDVPSGAGSVLEYFALDYIFKQLGIRKLCCEVFAFNTSVIKLHKKFGFKEEGHYLKHVLKNDIYEDVIALALFKEDLEAVRPAIEKLIFRESK